MSKIVEVRGVKIGEGIPKIIVPIVAKTKEEILAAAASFAGVRYDIVEWRVDWFDGVFDFAQVEDVLKDLRPALGDKPILFTFRTSKEGGEKAIEADAYAELNKKAAATGLVDMVDVEAFTGDEIVKDIIAGAHAAGETVVQRFDEASVLVPGMEESRRPVVQVAIELRGLTEQGSGRVLLHSIGQDGHAPGIIGRAQRHRDRLPLLERMDVGKSCNKAVSQ